MFTNALAQGTENLISVGVDAATFYPFTSVQDLS